MWPERHGHNERYSRLRLRQQLYRLTEMPAKIVDEIRDQFGVSHWHEAEVPEVDPNRASALAPGTFDGAALLRQAIDHDANLTQVTDEGIYEMLDPALDPGRRRVVLSRLSHTADPAVIQMIADELATRGSGTFGSLPIHDLLTLDQLHALAELRTELSTQHAWIAAVIRRMRPPASIDLDIDRAQRAVYLQQLWSFVGALPPASNSLKAHVLWHLLDAGRQRDASVDPSLFTAYLQLPRNAGYLPRALLERVRRDDIAELGRDFRDVTGLGPAGDDEALVRDLLQRSLANANRYAQWLDRAWFDGEVATAQLLAGDPTLADRATVTLGPARAQALREKVELAWCPHNPTRFGLDEPIALDLDVKNVPELVVKVFRIDPLAYFQHHRREVATDVDLDGLAASNELALRFSEPPVRRVRRRIDLPMCSRAGSYVIDLIGNGMSSRAVVHKGRLRHVSRLGAAGHVVTLVDDAGRPRPDARVWIGNREYVPDERGSIVVPFSTNPAATPMLLSSGDVTSVDRLELQRETYELGLELWLDRESLTAGRTARAVATIRLTVAGADASLSLVKRPICDITLTDRDGVSTTKALPLELSDDESAVIDFPLGDDTAQLALTVRGAVEVISEQREQELSRSASCEIASIHGGSRIEALYLAHTAGGWVLYALGKSGEPRAHRPVTIGLVHRWSQFQQNVELATDAQGRIALGELPGLARMSATLGSLTQSWALELWAPRIATHVAAGADAVVSLPPARDAVEVLRRASLVETRGNVIVRFPEATLEALAGAIAIRGLASGDYRLRAPGLDLAITVAPVAPTVAGWVVTPTEAVELSRPAPAIAALASDGSVLRIAIRGATPRTRVHVIAKRFEPAPIAINRFGLSRSPARRFDRERGATYLSGRDIGDEYRYILDRRSAKRYPNLLLDKPSLLLNPWARRTTTTDVAHARGSGGFGGAAQRIAAPQMMRGGVARPPVGSTAELAGYDFVGEVPAAIANLRPDASGALAIPLVELGRSACVTVVCDDPGSTTWRTLPLVETALDPRDLRLRLALDPARHVSQRKEILPLATGEQLAIEDLATAKVHLIDSIERAFAYLLALGDDATLREFDFVTRWHSLDDDARRELYSKYACHELHLFLYFKDRPWFDAVIAPYLSHKRTKTFIDHWLLGADLAPYLEPCKLQRLNAVERALLAQRITAGEALARLLADEVAIIPPDPALDTRLIDSLLGASTLHGDGEIAAARDEAMEMSDTTGVMAAAAPTEALSYAPPGGPMSTPAPAATRARAIAPAKKMAKTVMIGSDSLDDDMADRQVAAPMYRAADKTQEWAENNWWHRTPAESGADMIGPNRLWRDLARHRAGPFLSPWLGLATGNFAEAMCALAVTELPFAAQPHAFDADGPRLTITVASAALAGSSQLVDGELVDGTAPLVVGMSYVRDDDRHDWVDGEQVDKYVDSFVTGVVYTCRVVLANPTSARQRIAALMQIPRGSVPTSGAKPTHTIDVLLAPYATHGHEYSFYFPAPGAWTHFPVHVSRAGVIVVAAPARTLAVGTGAAAIDPRSWPHLSQRGSLAEVVDYLATANLAATDLDRVAWRLKYRDAYDAIVGALEGRGAYHATVWGYALFHRDRARIRTWLRSLDTNLLPAGPALDMPMVELDAEALDAYEHLEYTPLVNARAHRLGPKLRILNDGLAAQYNRFLDLVAHRAAPTVEDRLAAAGYLLAQDRVDDALAQLALVTTVADRMQRDYLAAYAACLVGELPRARALATPWREVPVDRWGQRFQALVAMLDEVDGAAPVVVDPRSREQQQAELAARQPTFDIAVDRDGVVVRAQHIGALELRFFEMDIELLFSRQPFVASDVSRFSFIEPGHREQVAQPGAESRVAWPTALRGKNVVVEAVAAGARKAKVHYANDLATNLAHQYGQIRVQRASDRAPLVATYVKVYARARNGSVTFYKDGYTDLRGWFDYATLSTTELDNVERFAILVCSDHAGSAILEADVPAR